MPFANGESIFVPLAVSLGEVMPWVAIDGLAFNRAGSPTLGFKCFLERRVNTLEQKPQELYIFIISLRDKISRLDKLLCH